MHHIPTHLRPLPSLGFSMSLVSLELQLESNENGIITPVIHIKISTDIYFNTTVTKLEEYGYTQYDNRRILVSEDDFGI